MTTALPTTAQGWIDFADLWFVQGRDFVPYYRNTGGLQQPGPVIREAALAAIDARLPVALQGMADNHLLLKINNSIGGTAVRATLHHWHQPFLLSLYDGSVANVHKIKTIYYKPPASSVALMAQIYNIEEFTIERAGCEPMTLPLVTEFTTTNVRVHTDAMETTFPGWHARWLAASAIGYEAEALAAAVCVRASCPLPAVSLDDMEF